MHRICCCCCCLSAAQQVSSDARLVCLMWRYCWEMCAKLGKHCEALRPTVLLQVLQLLTSAATLAIHMQRAAAAAASASAGGGAGLAAAGARRVSSSSSGGSASGSSSSEGSGMLGPALGDISDADMSDDEGSGPTGSSVWGGRPGAGVAGVSDEDVQAQAWLPQLLLGMLHWASSAARTVRAHTSMCMGWHAGLQRQPAQQQAAEHAQAAPQRELTLPSRLVAALHMCRCVMSWRRPSRTLTQDCPACRLRARRLSQKPWRICRHVAEADQPASWLQRRNAHTLHAITLQHLRTTQRNTLHRAMHCRRLFSSSHSPTRGAWRAWRRRPRAWLAGRWKY